MRAKKSLGQHFLKNPKVVETIVNAGEVKKDDTVIEIGPGTGVLTSALLKTGAHVIAIEADERALPVLEDAFAKELKTEQLTILHEDIRTFDITSLNLVDRGYKVIANIPYYISGMLFEKMLTCSTQPETLVFLVQKEVAERITKSKKESLLSLSVKAYGTPKYISTVVKGNFNPPPSVDSAVIKVSNISRMRFEKISETDFFALLKAGLGAKRKQLLGNLTSIRPRESLEHIFSTLNIPLDARGEDIPLETWLNLAYALETK